MSTINVTSRKTARSASFEYDLGKNLDEAVAKFGADVVFAAFEDAAVVKIQGVVRRNLDDEKKSVEDAVQAGQNYTPGVVSRKGGGAKKDPVAALATKINAPETTDEEKAKLKKQLKDLIASL